MNLLAGITQEIKRCEKLKTQKGESMTKCWKCETEYDESQVEKCFLAGFEFKLCSDCRDIYYPVIEEAKR